jgi:hypothetical protein
LVEDLHPLDPAEKARVLQFLEHARECTACARSVEVLRRFDRLIATLVRGPREIVGPCPEPEALVTWLAGERAFARRLELHLVACLECREDILAASQACGYRRAVATVSTRRLRLSSARLTAKTSRRLRLDSQDGLDDGDDEPDTPVSGQRRQGGVGLLALLLTLGSLFVVAAAAHASPRVESPRRSGGSMSAPGVLGSPLPGRNADAGEAGQRPVEDGRL